MPSPPSGESWASPGHPSPIMIKNFPPPESLPAPLKTHVRMTFPQLPSPLLSICIPDTSEDDTAARLAPSSLHKRLRLLASAGSSSSSGATGPRPRRAGACVQRGRAGNPREEAVRLGTSRARERGCPGQLPKAAGACRPLASASCSPVTCRVSAPSLEGRRMLVAVQGLGPEAWTLATSRRAPPGATGRGLSQTQ